MNQDKQEFQLNGDICEAVNCSARADTTILVKTGNRSIALNLCNSCTSKFEDTAAEEESNIWRRWKPEEKMDLE
jgi:hypothetical protein